MSSEKNIFFSDQFLWKWHKDCSHCSCCPAYSPSASHAVFMTSPSERPFWKLLRSFWNLPTTSHPVLFFFLLRIYSMPSILWSTWKEHIIGTRKCGHPRILRHGLKAEPGARNTLKKNYRVGNI